jgi:hypothetical protein
MEPQEDNMHRGHSGEEIGSVITSNNIRPLLSIHPGLRRKLFASDDACSQKRTESELIRCRGVACIDLKRCGDWSLKKSTCEQSIVGVFSLTAKRARPFFPEPQRGIERVNEMHGFFLKIFSQKSIKFPYLRSPCANAILAQ